MEDHGGTNAIAKCTAQQFLLSQDRMLERALTKLLLLEWRFHN